MFRSLIFYWRLNLAVIFAAATATAVLTGALLVGDSVKGSLRDLTLQRLGEIDFALQTPTFVREDLARDLSGSAEFNRSFDAVSAAILLQGNARHSQTQARASNVNIIAIDEEFPRFFQKRQNATNGVPASTFWSGSQGALPPLKINRALQKELQASPGDEILLTVEKPSAIARGSLLGRKNTGDVAKSLRCVVADIVGDQSMGRFSLRAHQQAPMNAFLPLPVLQHALGGRKQINAILVSEKAGRHSGDAGSVVQEALAQSLALSDLNLKFVHTPQGFALESKTAILSPQLVALTQRVAEQQGLSVLPAYTYLANKIQAGGRVLPYSTVTALPFPVPERFGRLFRKNGAHITAVAENEILLNEWAARDLHIGEGDTLEMTYFAVGPRDDLYEKKNTFRVRAVVAMRGLAADQTLTPDYPGISEVENMADWDPPFPVDLSLIRKKDEDYWDRYRGTPKAFVSQATGVKLWGSRFGHVTSLRFAAGADAEEIQQKFTTALLQAVDPPQFGFVLQPVKRQGLASSRGATDFSGLFIGFSQFLIVSAALLVGLLFRLGTERRVKELGARLALGFSQKKIRRQLLGEGSVLATAGALLGLGGALFYAWLLMVGLRTWWLPAVGTPSLFLHVTANSLITGFVLSLSVIIFSIWMAFRRLSKIPPPALLHGVTQENKTTVKNKRIVITAYSALAGALILTFVSVFSTSGPSPELFFGVGMLLLVSGLAFFSLWMRGRHKPLGPQGNAANVLKLAARNTPRNAGRSMLSLALVSSACFVIVAVGAFRTDFGEELLRKDSGAGGYNLLAQSDIPLYFDLNREEGRFELGFSNRESELLAQTQIMPFRYRPGDDASCLNLYQVAQPRLLGVPQQQIARGGFRFTQTLQGTGDDATNPWQLLNEDLGEDVIPAFGDANSVQWILHSGLGKDILLRDEFGKPFKLRFVGLLKKSIFQSELLISEQNFLKHFPSQSGHSFFLIRTAAKQTAETTRMLERTLAEYGFDASTTAERLASFQAVENTYLSTFQTLGGLGLLLGTLGLGMILIRNVLERRGELATLRAFGFRQATLIALVVAENGFLLFLGLALGSLAAAVAVVPHMLTDVSQVPWFSLAATLGVVFLVGMLASVVAVRGALRIPLIPALRAE